MRIITYFILLVVILLGVSFAVLNPGEVTVHYMVGQRTMSLSWLLACVFGGGSVLGLVVAMGLLVRLKIKNMALAHKLKLAEREVENLRAIPLKDTH